MVEKIALVDIDGCLVQDGRLNMALVDRLKNEGYQQIALFTQRSKFMMYQRWMRDEAPSDKDSLFFTPNIVAALAKQGLSVRVSTSIDHCFGEPLAYYESDLAPCERQYGPLLQAYNPSRVLPTPEQSEMLVRLRKDVLSELQNIAKTVTDEMIRDIAVATIDATMKDMPPRVLQNQLELVRQTNPEATQETLKAALIAREESRLTKILHAIHATNVEDLPAKLDDLAILISEWSIFHPTSKIIQKQVLDEALPKAQIDYFDDSATNITEIHAADPEHALNSCVVNGAFIIPLAIYQAKGFVESREGKTQLSEALALDSDTFSVDDISCYLAHDNRDIQAFGQQLLDVARKKDGQAVYQAIEQQLAADREQHGKVINKITMLLKACEQNANGIVSDADQETLKDFVTKVVTKLAQRPLPGDLSTDVKLYETELNKLSQQLHGLMKFRRNENESASAFQGRLITQGLAAEEASRQATIAGVIEDFDEARGLLLSPRFEQDRRATNRVIQADRQALNPVIFKTLMSDIHTAQQRGDMQAVLAGFYALDVYVTPIIKPKYEKSGEDFNIEQYYGVVRDAMAADFGEWVIPDDRAHQVLTEAIQNRYFHLAGEPADESADQLAQVIHMSNGFKIYQQVLQSRYAENSDNTQIPQEINDKVMQAVTGYDQKLFDAPFNDASVSQSSIPAALYQQYLQEKAFTQAVADPTSYRFDPQMHVLTQVTLTGKDYQNITESILKARGETEMPSSTAPKSQLEALLGQPITPTTLCNLDITQRTELAWRFTAWANDVDVNMLSLPTTSWQWFRAYIGGEKTQEAIRQENIKIFKTNCLAGFQDKLADAVTVFAKRGSESGSVNALQEELEMHVGLALNVFKKAFELHPPSAQVAANQWDSILATAQQEMQARVRGVFQQALVASYKDGQLDYDKLNKTLDKARKGLGATCRSVLMQQCEARIPHFKARCDISVIKLAVDKHAFEATTASTNDYFSYNALGVNAHISGTGNTAHHKAVGLGHQALRILSYDDGSVTLRAPSIPDVEKKALSLDKHIDDTTVKIHEIVNTLNPRLPAHYDGPIILNRETSLPSGADKYFDDKKNKQTLRFEIEVKAIHQYNASRGKGRLMLMQAIAVNQHTQALSHTSASVMVREATLMADMAMLANLAQQFKGNGQLSGAYAIVSKQYQDFLTENKGQLRTATFSASPQGQSALATLQSVKALMKPKVSIASSASDIKVLASTALAQIFAHDLHHDPRYGMLVQALSTFTQTATVAGCKSANERFAAVESRAALLRLLHVNNCQLPQAKDEMAQALCGLINSPDPQSVQAQMAVLQATLNTYHNQHTVQIRSAAAVSGLDQGAAAKLQSFIKSWFKPLQWFKNLNTNLAENTDMTRLHANKAGKLQAHKLKVSKYHKEITGLPGGIEQRCFASDSPVQHVIDFLSQKLHGFSLMSLVRTGGRLNSEQKQQLQALIDDLHNPLVTFSGAELQQKIEGILGREPKSTAILAAFTQLANRVQLAAVKSEYFDTVLPLKTFLQEAADNLKEPPTEVSPHVDHLVSTDSDSDTDCNSDTDCSDNESQDEARQSPSSGYQAVSVAEGEEVVLAKQLRSLFDAKRIDPALKQDDEYAVSQSGFIVNQLNEEQKQHLVSMLPLDEKQKAGLLKSILPPAPAVNRAESSVASEDKIAESVSQRAGSWVAKYGPLAVAVASFVLGKGLV